MLLFHESLLLQSAPERYYNDGSKDAESQRAQSNDAEAQKMVSQALKLAKKQADDAPVLTKLQRENAQDRQEALLVIGQLGLERSCTTLSMRGRGTNISLPKKQRIHFHEPSIPKSVR